MTGVDRSVTIRLRLASDQFDAAALKSGATVRIVAAEIEGAGNKASLTGKKLDELGFNADKSAKGFRQLSADVKKADENNTSAAKSSGVLLASVVALGPALIPIGAAAIGGAGALGLMGVAGILAVKGVSAEMAAGTHTGNQYSAGVHQIKADLQQMEGVAARGVLGSFNQALAQGQTLMPGLNSEVSKFSVLAGKTAANIFTGVIADGKQLSPLFTKVGMDVLNVSKDFETWSSNGGLKKFEAYAMNALPKVESTLSAVAQAVLAITGASAPLGGVSLQAMHMLADGVNALPVGVLQTLIPLLAAGYLGFKAYTALAPVIATVRSITAALKAYEVQQLMTAGVTAEAAAANASAAGGVKLLAGRVAAGASSFGLMGGAIGLVTLGLGAAAYALYKHSQATHVDKQEVQDLTAALVASNGAIDANAKLILIKKLSDAGAYDAAGKLGLTQKTVTDALLGSNSALAQVNAATKAASDSIAQYHGNLAAAPQSAIDTSNAIGTLNGVLADQSSTLAVSRKEAIDQQAALTGSTATVNAAALAQENLAAKYGMSVPVYEAAAKATADNGAQLAATTAQMVLQENASGLLKASLDALDGKQLSAAQAQNQFEQALVSMVKKVGQGDAALHGLSSSAVANRGELLGLVTAAESAAGTTGDLASSSVAAKSKLLELRQQIIDNAVAHGEDRQAVTDYINTVLDIKKLSIPPTKLDVDTAAALARIAALRAEVTKAVAFIDGQVAVVHVTTYNPATHGTAGGRQAFADGGMVGGVGGPRSDNQLILASPGERIVQNGPSQQYAPLLDAMIAGRPLPRFADGGIVTITPARPSASSRAASSTAAANKEAALLAAQAQVRWTISTDLPKVATAAMGSVSQVAAAMGKLINDVHTATLKGLGNSALIRTLQAEDKQLMGLAGERKVIAGQLKAANATLAADRAAYVSEQAKVADTERSLFDISNAGNNNGYSSADSIERSLQAESDKIDAFNTGLVVLRGKGLDNHLIAKLGEDGADVAGTNVAALTHATSGQIKTIDALYGHVNASASKVGATVAGSLYQAGIDSAVGYVNGLKSKDKQVQQAASSLAALVSGQVKKDLGIRSPSTVFFGHGVNSADGYVLGVNSRMGAVRASVSGLATAAAVPIRAGAGVLSSAPRTPAAGLVQLSPADRQLLTAAVAAMGDVRVSGRLTADHAGISASVSQTQARRMK